MTNKENISPKKSILEKFSPEYVNNLQNKVNSLNNTYSQKLSQIELIKQQNQNILQQFNCNNLEELIQLKNNLETELETLIPEAEKYINTLEQEIIKIDNILIQS